MTRVEIALLSSEWVEHVGIAGVQKLCPACGASHARGAVHERDCVHDMGLAELGYPTQKERDMFRERIVAASRVTDPPAEE